MRGLNGVMFDGSGRWISRDQVTWTGSEGPVLSTHYSLQGNMHNWAQQKLRLGR